MGGGWGGRWINIGRELGCEGVCGGGGGNLHRVVALVGECTL